MPHRCFISKVSNFDPKKQINKSINLSICQKYTCCNANMLRIFFAEKLYCFWYILSKTWISIINSWIYQIEYLYLLIDQIIWPKWKQKGMPKTWKWPKIYITFTIIYSSFWLPNSPFRYYLHTKTEDEEEKKMILFSNYHLCIDWL